MANKTIKDAKSIHGTNPQYLIEKIIRTRIYENRYWKEDCFGLTADLVVDRGAELRYIGGTYGGNIKTAPFLCLTLKLLQIQPEKDIIIEFIRQENFKYIRALGAFYLRLVGNSLDIYKYLEPLYNDFRKLRRMTKMGTFDIIYMDEFIDQLLREDRVFDVILPRLVKRFIHEENGELPKRISLIEEDLYAEDDHDNDDNDDDKAKEVASSDSEDEHRKHRELKKLRQRSRTPPEKSRSTTRRRDYDDYDEDDDYHHRNRYERDRRRSRSISPRRPHHHSRHHRHRSNSRDRDSRRDYDRHHHQQDDYDRSSKKYHRNRRNDDDGMDQPEQSTSENNKKGKSEADEIAEANALRAKLGLKPLRP